MEAATNPEELLEALNSLIAGVGEVSAGQQSATSGALSRKLPCSSSSAGVKG